MNGIKKIKKGILITIVNKFLSGTRFFTIKRVLLNQCEGIQIGQGTKVVAPIYIPIQSIFHIGEECWIGRDMTLDRNGEVYIGDNCDLGPEVSFITGSHTIGNADRRAGKGFNGIIRIASGVWLGAKTVILPNIDIGKGTVVGAAAVVTKTLQDNGIYAGSPAKRIRDL